VDNENLQELYRKVFQKLKFHPDIANLKKGILYKTIQILLGEEGLNSQAKTKEICDYFWIKPNSSIDEDRKTSEELVSQIVSQISMGRKSSIRSTRTNQDKNQGIYMEYIFVVAACILVGVYASKKYIDQDPQQKPKLIPIDEPKKQLPVPVAPIPADLCLIVPASVASNFSPESKLTHVDLIHLIDNASYFLCTQVETTDSNEQNLEITAENIPSDSRREVYMRININDGRNIIEQKIPYYLKTHLPNQAHCIVKKLACLKNLSGLDKFNRV